jgi:methyl-accepting chemotaxis protein
LKDTRVGVDRVFGSFHHLARNASDAHEVMNIVMGELTTVSNLVVEQRKIALNINQKMEDTLQLTQSGKGKVEGMNSAMGDISAKSVDIASATKLIDAVSFQTNILASNDAIEAARACALGKGFAVVADEVRSLSKRTAESSQGIQNSLDQLIRNIGNSATGAESILGEFAMISDQVGVLGKYIRSIAGHMDVQSTAMDRLQSEMSNFSKMADENVECPKVIDGTLQVILNQFETLSGVLVG